MAYDDLKVEPNKQRIDVITIHQEKCGLIFSSTNFLGTCTATGEPCFQGWATCRDQANYSPVDFPIQICTAADNSPAGMLPYLKPKGVTHEPTEPDPEVSLGKRAVLRMSFLDAPHDDVGIDPYVESRAYDPLERGTFWSKLRVRFPFYTGRTLEWHTGFMHEPFDLANLKRRSFIIESFSGWGPRNLPQMVAKDPLKFADDDRAVYPPKSRGVLRFGMTDSTVISEIDIITPDVDEYDLESFEPVGIVRVGNECFSFTGIDKVSVTGGVRLTGASRSIPAPYLTVKESHNANDLVQKCAYFFQMRPDEIYKFFLVSVAGLPLSYIPGGGTVWQEESETWIAGLKLTRIVADPQGVVSHINEIIPQASTWGLWFDDESDLIQYRVNRPIDYNEGTTVLRDGENLIADRTIPVDENGRLVNEVYIAHGQRDPTKKQDDVSNYRAGVTTANPTSQSPRENGQRRIKTIFARWSPQGNRAELVIMADRMMINRSTVPVKITFEVEVKDDDIRFGDFIDLTTMALLDAFGEVRPNVRFRIIEAKQGDIGLSLAAREEFYQPLFGRWAPETYPAGYEWDDATDEEKMKYLFWSEADGTLGVNNDPGKEWL